MSKILNVEIKARCHNPEFIHSTLLKLGANYRGCDHQIDTYFNCPNGRLKLRQGNIENSLIFYQRSNQAGPKQSDIALERIQSDSHIKTVLTMALGIKTEVDKKRHIYFIENVKFHVDEVMGLGSFMEIEAIDETGEIGLNRLQQLCEQYMQLLKIELKDLITHSYSDLLQA
jgi:adenylate cyclase, class 2